MERERCTDARRYSTHQCWWRSDAVFTLGNRVVAGAYDYSLHKGNGSGSDLTGWYLTSMTSVPQIQPEQPSSSQIPLHMYRPEAAAYTANLMAANMLFDLSMRDHSGETRYNRSSNGLRQKDPHVDAQSRRARSVFNGRRPEQYSNQSFMCCNWEETFAGVN